MSFLKGALNLTRLSVGGAIKENQILAGLQDNKFKEPTCKAEIKMQNIGFCRFFDMNDFTFPHSEVVKIDQYYIFGVRIDTRKVPAGLLKTRVKEAKKRFLDERPDLKRIPIYELDAIKDAVRRELIDNAHPSPAMYQVAWNSETDEILIDTRTKGAIENIANLLRHAFPDLRFIPEAPISRAMGRNVIAEKYNEAKSDTVMDLAKLNIPLWQNFFNWLFYLTYKGQEPDWQFVAEVDDKFVLTGENEYGKQKLTITGSQGKCEEIRAALSNHMRLDVVGVRIITDEQKCSVNLDSEWLGINGAKIPFEQPEPSDDEYADKVASFVIRMADIAMMQSVIDSLVDQYFEALDSTAWDCFESNFDQWISE